MLAALIILEIYWIEYFKIVFLIIIYNCTYKAPFCKSSNIYCNTFLQHFVSLVTIDFKLAILK